MCYLTPPPTPPTSTERGIESTPPRERARRIRRTRTVILTYVCTPCSVRWRTRVVYEYDVTHTELCAFDLLAIGIHITWFSPRGWETRTITQLRRTDWLLVKRTNEKRRAGRGGRFSSRLFKVFIYFFFISIVSQPSCSKNTILCSDVGGSLQSTNAIVKLVLRFELENTSIAHVQKRQTLPIILFLCFFSQYYENIPFLLRKLQRKWKNVSNEVDTICYVLFTTNKRKRNKTISSFRVRSWERERERETIKYVSTVEGSPGKQQFGAPRRTGENDEKALDERNELKKMLDCLEVKKKRKKQSDKRIRIVYE